MASTHVTRATLKDAPARVGVPNYDVTLVQPGIVHLGFGGFHRAHMARYTHNLMNTHPTAHTHLQWGIVGVGLLPADARMKECMDAQDNLYTLVERSGVQDQECVTIVGSVAGYVFAPTNVHTLLATLDDVRVRVVSLTVTEYGYCLNRATNRLDFDNEMIAHDVQNVGEPKSAIGVIVAAYARRRASGSPAFTAMSCDNIQHNGHVLEQAVLDFAGKTDPSLALWITRNASFPNTMVDRITPITQPQHIDYLRANYGIDDKWPVFCEAFMQWVIEDKFVQGRPQWEQVGAQFVSDVAPYEFMKLRLLNASHLAVAGVGQLCGYTHIHETMQNKNISGYMRALMDRETGQTLKPVPGVDLDVYKRTLIERFANPEIKDTVQRVNTDAPLATLVDSARDRLESANSVDLLALGIAAWLRRVRGEDEKGVQIEIRHPMAEKLRALAVQGGSDPTPLLSISSLFGSLANDSRFVSAVGKWLEMLYKDGALRTIEYAAKTLNF